MIRETGVLNGEPRLQLDEASVVRCLEALGQLPHHRPPAGGIEVAFVDPAACSRLHRDFFGDPDPTDVMTFPGDPEDGHAGDIAICPAVAAEACRETALPFAEELTLYLVHAWLHLAGLRDDQPDAIARMRAAEDLLMDHLRRSGALLDCAWRG